MIWFVEGLKSGDLELPSWKWREGGKPVAAAFEGIYFVVHLDVEPSIHRLANYQISQMLLHSFVREFRS